VYQPGGSGKLDPIDDPNFHPCSGAGWRNVGAPVRGAPSLMGLLLHADQQKPSTKKRTRSSFTKKGLQNLKRQARFFIGSEIYQGRSRPQLGGSPQQHRLLLETSRRVDMSTRRTTLAAISLRRL
jgi:hypothetical protein